MDEKPDQKQKWANNGLNKRPLSEMSFVLLGTLTRSHGKMSSLERHRRTKQTKPFTDWARSDFLYAVHFTPYYYNHFASNFASQRIQSRNIIYKCQISIIYYHCCFPFVHSLLNDFSIFCHFFARFFVVWRFAFFRIDTVCMLRCVSLVFQLLGDEA